MVSPHFLSPGQRAGGALKSTRWAMVLGAIGLAAVLAVARWLEPDPRGYGTHTQLGLYPCMFFQVTGHRCPSCGMTTAFAWFMRGRFDRSWQANPAGCVLSLLTVPIMAWLVWSAVANEPAGFSSLSRPLVVLLVGAVVLSLA